MIFIEGESTSEVSGCTFSEGAIEAILDAEASHRDGPALIHFMDCSFVAESAAGRS